MDFDDELITSLRDIASQIDALPPEVHDAARAAHLALDLDSEIAVLVVDTRVGSPSPSAFAPVRDADETPGQWLLSFSGGGVEIDVEVEDAAPDGLRLLVQFTGATGGDYQLETSGGSRCLDVDDLGRLVISGVPHGPIRIRCRAASGAPVTTAWVTI
jgi:hypothetical protein